MLLSIKSRTHLLGRNQKSERLLNSLEMKHELCQIPTCRNYQRYCRIHRQESFAPITPVKKVGDKMKEDLKIYRKEARKFITANPKCKMNMKGCEGEARCVHHSKGRIGDLLLDKRYWVPSCYHCNLMVEIKDAEARNKGLKLSKFI